MLVATVRNGETIVLTVNGKSIGVKLLDSRNGRSKLGIDAPVELTVTFPGFAGKHKADAQSKNTP